MSRILKIGLIAFLMCLMPTIILALPDQMSFEHIGVDDGLSQSTVRVMYQDHLGYLWFGTDDGLNRYDGYAFKVFCHNRADSTTLSSSAIRLIIEDAANQLWVLTSDGVLNRYNPIDDTFDRFQVADTMGRMLNGKSTSSLLVDPANKLWLHFSPLFGVQGLFSIDIHSGQVRQFDPEKFQNSDAEQVYITASFIDQKGQMWVATSEDVLYKVEESAQQLQPVTLPDPLSELKGVDRIFAMFEDSKGDFWLIKKSGLYRFNPATQSLTHYPHKKNDAHSISSDTVNDILEDNNGHQRCR